MNTYRCPRCNTPVIIRQGRLGTVCPKCRRAVMLEEVQRKPQTGLFLLRLYLVIIILASVGLLAFYLTIWPAGPRLGNIGQYIADAGRDVAEEIIKPGSKAEGKPHARNVVPRRFSLWELYSNDTVRIVEIITNPGAKDQKHWVVGPSLRPGDKILAESAIGGHLLQQKTYEEVYGGETYLRHEYQLKVEYDQFGYELQVKRPPHLHIYGEDRLISLGVDPKSYAEEIFAVAIPKDAFVTSIFDYQPYRYLERGDWDIFFYDTSNIGEHASIHISYRTGGQAAALDWRTVEAGR
ncbi:MAG: hypothetical protein JXM69_08935 [Anaerolineae bacterium]|nr:hypothetical protein [Anaerolineae bacterium]